MNTNQIDTSKLTGDLVKNYTSGARGQLPMVLTFENTTAEIAVDPKYHYLGKVRMDMVNSYKRLREINKMTWELPLVVNHYRELDAMLSRTLRFLTLAAGNTPPGNPMGIIQSGKPDISHYGVEYVTGRDMAKKFNWNDGTGDVIELKIHIRNTVRRRYVDQGLNITPDNLLAMFDVDTLNPERQGEINNVLLY